MIGARLTAGVDLAAKAGFLPRHWRRRCRGFRARPSPPRRLGRPVAFVEGRTLPIELAGTYSYRCVTLCEPSF